MNLQLIQTKIHEIRGEKVLLDSDLAELYGIETKKLNQAIKRNFLRFPEDFMFRLTREENNFLRSQIVTLENGKGKYSKYLPYAFTEQGVAMLSSVLNSKEAIEVNIYIMRTFVLMRKFALSYEELSKRISELEGNYSDIYEALNFLLQKEKSFEKQSTRKQLGYKNT